MEQPERRLLIAVDMERYSRRTNLQQYEAQRAFQLVLHEAATAVGLDRISWRTQQAGDGELAILPTDAREPRVIGRLVPELDRLLRRYNADRLPEARVRLRVALHQGMVHLDGANGFPGSAAVEVCRLCDADQLKHALAAFPNAGVALIVSDGIYRDVVVEYPEELRPERFRRVEVRHPGKDFRQPAWICVIDEDLSTLPEWTDLTEPAPGTRPGRDPRRSSPGARGRSVPRDRSGWASGAGIRTGDVRVHGPNAIGHGALAIGSVGDNARIRGEGADR
jgi:hypothetical protein